MILWTRTLRVMLYGLLVAAASGAPSVWAESKKEMHLGVFAYRPVEVMQAHFQPLVDYLNATIEQGVIHLHVLSLDELEQAVAQRRMDLILTNPSHYHYLRHRYAVQGPMVTLLRLEQGLPTRYLGGVILARHDSGIEQLEDLKGQQVGIPGQYFLGGFQAQAYELIQHQIDLQRDLELVELGNHDAVMQALLQGRLKAGFVRTGILEDWQREGRMQPDALRVIHAQAYVDFPFSISTQRYPEWPLAPVSECECARELVRALLNLSADHPAVLTLGIAGFTVPADYSVMDRLALALKLPPYDQLPEITLVSFWNKYGLWLIPFVLLGLLTAGLTFALLHFNQHLRKANQRFHLLYERIPFSVFLLNPDTRCFEDCNPACLALFEAERPDQVLGKTPCELSPPYQPDGVSSPDKAAELIAWASDRDGDSFHWVHRSCTGKLITVEVTLLPMQMHGKTMILGVQRDLTEELRLQQASEQLLDKFQKLAAHLPGMLYQYRQWPDGHSAFPYVSQGIRNIYGLSPEAVKEDASAVNSVIHPADLPRVASSIQHSIDTQAPWHLEYRARPQGDLIWLEGTATPQRLEDGSTLWHGYIAEITERVSLEEARRQQTEALQVSNAELEHFTYVVSHDLRQPLRMVNSYLQLLARRLGPELQGDNQVMLNYALEGGQRLDQMLLSLLEYSRVGRKGQPQEWMNIRSAIDEALLFLNPEITEQKAQVSLQTDVWPQIYASPDEMTRLFQNLIGNALKYHRPDQHPVVRIGVEAMPEPMPEHWRFYVEDEGIGIDPEQADRVFRMFQRLHSRGEFEGSGVGLAICRKILERQGGKIWVETPRSGLGSRFYFTLPQVEPESF